MKTEFANYRRIAKGAAGMSSLWQGPDHLVYVRGSGILLPFSEDYLRFRYRDIQAFTVRRTGRIVMSLLWGLLAVVPAAFGFLILAVRDPGPVGPVALFFLASFFGSSLLGVLGLVRHLILGPTCRCEIMTSLKRENLRPLNRLHRAHEAIALMEGPIREAQARERIGEDRGGDPRDSLARREREKERDFALRVSPLVPATFGVFTLFAFAGLVTLVLESLVITGLGFALFSVGALLLLATLILSVRVPTPDPLRASLWALLGSVFVLFGTGAVFFVVAASENPEYTIGILGPLEAFSAVMVAGGAFFFWLHLALLVTTLLVSLAGLIQTARWRERVAAAREDGQSGAEVIAGDADSDE